tara:strand:- start:996 stop:1238 length:243 start_codon:yes stop_codon:yes gene_type:complete
MEDTREQFIRIAMAILKNEYRFRPQRLAVASKMYRKWIEKKNKMEIDVRSDKSLYVTIGDYTYYIDDSTDEQIINKWKNK